MVMKKKEYTSVWLKRNTEESHIFFCHTCQCPEFKYQGSVVMMTPADNEDDDFMYMSFPIRIQCRNKNCPSVYVIEGFVG